MSLRDRLERVALDHIYTTDVPDFDRFLNELVEAVLAGRMPAEKLWVYQGRHGELELHRQFSTARHRQDEDNRVTLDEIIAQGDSDWGGSEEEGHFYIDDGGRITLVEVQ